MQVRQPYVKQYNEKGECTNPITPIRPYLHGPGQTRPVRRGNAIVLFNELTSAYAQYRIVSSCKKKVGRKFPVKVGHRYAAA